MAYFICNQSGGSGYSETILHDTPTLLSEGSELTLNDDFDKFDALQFYLCAYDSVLYNHFTVITVPKNVLLKSYTDYNDSSISYSYKGRFETSMLLIMGSWYVCTWQLIAKEKNKLLSGSKGTSGWSVSDCYIYKIVGVKYG